MPKYDLSLNDRRWQKTRLFRKRRTNLLLRLGIIFVVMAAFMLIGHWLGIPQFNLPASVLPG